MSGDPTVNGELERSTLPAAGPVRVLEPRGRLLPALPLSNAVVAAGGVLAAVVALVTLRAARSRRRLPRDTRRTRRAVEKRSVAKRSFLVDVHLLGK